MGVLDEYGLCQLVQEQKGMLEPPEPPPFPSYATESPPYVCIIVVK